MNSIKTTVAGIAAIVAAIAMAVQAFYDGDPETVVNLEATVAAVLAGVGLLMAKDNSKDDGDGEAKSE